MVLCLHIAFLNTTRCQTFMEEIAFLNRVQFYAHRKYTGQDVMLFVDTRSLKVITIHLSVEKDGSSSTHSSQENY